jgi:hypothetical protein
VFGSAGGLVRGQCFCYAEIVRPQTSAGVGFFTLLADYVTNAATLGWPGGAIRQSVEGPGFLRSISVGNPAAGAEWSLTVPTNARWRVQAANSLFTASAGVANRVPECNLDDGANSFFIGEPNSVVVALGAPQVTFASTVPTAVANVADVTASIPSPAYLLAGHRINSRTLNIQAADQYSAIFVNVEEWIET